MLFHCRLIATFPSLIYPVTAFCPAPSLGPWSPESSLAFLPPLVFGRKLCEHSQVSPPVYSLPRTDSDPAINFWKQCMWPANRVHPSVYS